MMGALKTILVVDDNKINRKILEKILISEYDIIQAENGKIALDILHKKYESISVVLLDIVMPVLDGYEVLRQMHKDTFLSKIPVIVASGQSSIDAEVKALSLGANDYILKPYQTEIIRHRIANTIYLKETSAFVNSIQRDTLTGLYGREYFYLQVAEALRDNPSTMYDLICFDVEHFKLVNDRFGTQIGDEVLQHIARVLKEKIQGIGFCSRLEADKFACLLPHRDHYEKEFFTECIECINAFSTNIKLNLILRYGIYPISDRTTPANIMCDRAILAKDSIKGKYDIYFAYYDDTIRQHLLDEQLLVADMKTALKEKQFQVYFQPQYDLKTEKIVGAEALVRWIHPVKGFLSPAMFIPLFEKNGFISDLDFYVWEECCKKIQSWKNKGNMLIPISVNVSRLDIYDLDLPQKLLCLIQKYDLVPKNLHLEITESAYMENPEQLIDTISRLKKLGFIIEMDDFGTGYSSLNMLSELPIDILKLDMRFIQRQEQKNTERSVLSFIISLAKWMNLKVVAEGAETLEQVHFLQSLNCEYAQGYYYAKPMPHDQFERHLQEMQPTGQKSWNTGYAPLDSKRKNTQKTLLMLDQSNIDYPLLQAEYGRQYQVLCAENATQALTVLQENREEICALTVSLPNTITDEQMAALAESCKECALPMLLLYDQAAPPQAALLSLDIADYTARPYAFHQFDLRLQNAISRARMEKFEQEKEINAAIIEMRHRAEHDALTGLFNRSEYEIRIDHFFLKNNAPKGIFIILDVDNFKCINDTFGHVVGDKVLNTAGEQLRRLFPETEIIARIGGDEFSLFIPYIVPFERLQDKMSKLCTPFYSGIEDIKISCTVGICYCPQYGVDYKTLYQNADTALLRAKRQGKRQCAVFSFDMGLSPVAVLGDTDKPALNHMSDAMFVCDAASSEVLYINETACTLLGKNRESCLGHPCYKLFWDSCRQCERCAAIGQHRDDFYEETTFLKDHKTIVRIRARLEYWSNKAVKVHYLQIGSSREK